MDYLRDKQLPLEVCQSSNICLKVFPSLAEHSLPQLLAHGCYVTINSDDPPMFNTTLINEFLVSQKIWGWDQAFIKVLVFNAVNATLLPPAERKRMVRVFERQFEQIG
jgi:adenosine deaminase